MVRAASSDRGRDAGVEEMIAAAEQISVGEAKAGKAI